ncbi:hypothetical protein D3C87_1677580 [compost metagenome]
MHTGAGDQGDRQRRGVAGQHCIAANQLFQLPEQLLFGLEIFDDGLDQQVATRQFLQRVRRAHTPKGAGQCFGTDLALGCCTLQ